MYLYGLMTTFEPRCEKNYKVLHTCSASYWNYLPNYDRGKWKAQMPYMYTRHIILCIHILMWDVLRKFELHTMGDSDGNN